MSAFTAAATAACCSELTTMPLDFTRVRLQARAAHEHAGFIAEVRSIVRKEGLLAFWQGSLPACARQAAVAGVGVGFYPLVREKVGSKVVAGACGGALGQLIGMPADVVKTRLQAQRSVSSCSSRSSSSLYRGPFDCVARVVKEEGVLALWKGAAPALGRVAFMFGSSLATYDTAKTFWEDRLGNGSTPAHVLSSMSSGLVAAIVACPFDVVKTRLQLTQSEGSNVLRVISNVVRNDGFVRGFYSAFLPTYLRLGPWQLIFFNTLEVLTLAMNGKGFAR